MLSQTLSEEDAVYRPRAAIFCPINKSCPKVKTNTFRYRRDSAEKVDIGEYFLYAFLNVFKKGLS